MSDDPMGETCPHCGSAINPHQGDRGWQRTDETRLVHDGEETVTFGRVPVGGMFHRMEPVSFTSRVHQRYRIERLWIRKWAQAEWRRE